MGARWHLGGQQPTAFGPAAAVGSRHGQPPPPQNQFDAALVRFRAEAGHVDPEGATARFNSAL